MAPQMVRRTAEMSHRCDSACGAFGGFAAHIQQIVRAGLVIALVAAFGAPSESAAGTLYKTNPQHVDRAGRSGIIGFSPPPAPPPSSNVMAWFNGHPSHVALVDKALTAACQATKFNQRIPQFYKAIFLHTGNISQTLGWARQGSPNLYDPTGLAHAGNNYYFENDRSRKCRVYFLPD
jgi:hypothetical protein